MLYISRGALLALALSALTGLHLENCRLHSTPPSIPHSLSHYRGRSDAAHSPSPFQEQISLLHCRSSSDIALQGLPFTWTLLQKCHCNRKTELGRTVNCITSLSCHYVGGRHCIPLSHMRAPWWRWRRWLATAAALFSHVSQKHK